jgi:diguanylate cyclase (GGDEF)-like protein
VSTPLQLLAGCATYEGRHTWLRGEWPMELSVKTLFLINVAVLFLSSATAWYFWHLYRDSRDSAVLLWWSFGTAVAGLAYLVFGFFSPAPPPAVAVTAATLFIAGCTMIWESLRRFNGRPAAQGRMVVIVLAFAVILSTALYSGVDLRERVTMFSLAMAAFAVLCAWEVMRGSKQEALLSRLPMALVFAALAVALLGRAGVAWLHPPWLATETFYDAMGDLVPLTNTVGLVCLNIGFMIMISERLSSRSRKHALTDELTELPNRRLFLEQGDRLSRRAHKDGTMACILMMDLDHFSDVNQRFGHAGGDHALMAFARLLREQVPPTHIVARYGGEEFCAFLGGVEAAEGTAIAERLRATLAAQAIDIRGQTLKLTVSIGVAALSDGDLGVAIRSADEALYQAKDQGRDQVVFNQRKIPDPRSVERSVVGLARG